MQLAVEMLRSVGSRHQPGAADVSDFESLMASLMVVASRYPGAESSR